MLETSTVSHSRTQLLGIRVTNLCALLHNYLRSSESAGTSFVYLSAKPELAGNSCLYLVVMLFRQSSNNSPCLAFH